MRVDRAGAGVRKIAIVGFAATSLPEAPWEDGSWEKWILNNMWGVLKPGEYHRVYELHDTRDDEPTHIQWLQKNQTVPVYMSHPRDDTPMCQPFPVAEIVERFGTFFTNTISWMLAHALLECTEVVDEHKVDHGTGLHTEPLLRVTEPLQIGVWGVDMANSAGGEYAAQRPSCEYFIGLCRGLGVPVYIPEHSDLCKTGTMYAVGNDSPFFAVMQNRQRELTERLQQMNQGILQLDVQKANIESQRAQLVAQINHLNGGMEMIGYSLDVWCNPRSGRVVQPGNVAQALPPG